MKKKRLFPKNIMIIDGVATDTDNHIKPKVNKDIQSGTKSTGKRIRFKTDADSLIAKKQK